jgi:hypothetical protein
MILILYVVHNMLVNRKKIKIILKMDNYNLEILFMKIKIHLLLEILKIELSINRNKIKK